jgi:hypothetical protein
MLGIKSVISQADSWSAVAYAFSFVAYCIGSKDRWRRFLRFLPIVVLLVVAWWLFAHGGMLSLIHVYRETSGNGPQSLPKP